MRRALLAAAALAALAGCPLPQPLPELQRTGGSTVTPPRVLEHTAVPASGLVLVGTSCPPGTLLRFDADLEDPNVDEIVEARWFVDYAPTPSGSGFVSEFAPSSANPVDPVRSLAGYSYPVSTAPAGEHHLVELVVSNGFYPALTEPADVALPHRTAQPGYEAQVFRWVVLYDAAGSCPGG